MSKSLSKPTFHDKFHFYWETNISMIVDSIGAYDVEESAARAYDLAALKYWGTSTFTNFPVRTCIKLRKLLCNFLYMNLRHQHDVFAGIRLRERN